MRRRHHKLQAQMDDHLLRYIAEGRVTTPEQRQAVTRPYVGQLAIDETINGLNRAEETAATQRLRKRGLIEIGENNEAKMRQNLEPADVTAIMERSRMAEIGRASHMAVFCYQRKQFEESRQWCRVVLALKPDYLNLRGVQEALKVAPSTYDGD